MDAAGKLYFVDHHNQRIYGWSEKEGLTVERDNPLDPVNLAFDKSGNLLVVSSAGPREHGVYVPAGKLSRRTDGAEAAACAASRQSRRDPSGELVEQW